MNAHGARILRDLGLEVLERGWLSSNNIVIGDRRGCVVVDTGYDTHAEQTLSLLRHALAGRPLVGIVNTHLHSDHCGGNVHLQREMDCPTWVPAASFDDVRRWDEARLTYAATGQRCQRFRADRSIEPGETLRWGDVDWLAVEAPGHDPFSLMFFQPDSRVLISADALWERNLAVVFPELSGDDGFTRTHECLATIERLAPAVVIPGHGPAFVDVDRALAASHARLRTFVEDPRRHLGYALRALAMFRMLEHRRMRRDALQSWMREAPVFVHALGDATDLADTAVTAAVERLIDDGALAAEGDDIRTL